MRYLYIAEKPSTMQTVKSVYEFAGSPLGKIDFISLAGHVCGLLEPKEYPQWKDQKWADLPLPMIPDDFQVKSIKPAIVKSIQDKLKKEKYDAIIVGTDSDVEGNGIYALLEKKLNLYHYKALRFFEKDLTAESIMQSFKNLTDFHKNPRDVGMTQAYWIRAQFDWLIGHNMTVAYTVKTNLTMRVGRVKAPTLKLVYDNWKAIEDFQKKSSYLPTVTTKNPLLNATYLTEEGEDGIFEKKEDAERLLQSLGNKATVKKKECKLTKKAPPQLLKLSDVQYEAGQKYGYSLTKTLAIIQSLYEKHKVVSYPRTDGKYVSSERAKEFPTLIKAVAAVPELKAEASGISLAAINQARGNKRYVNDTEVAKKSHDALIPTGKAPDYSKMTAEEQKICTMIYKHFLAIFLPDLTEEKRKYFLDVDGKTFVCKGSKIVDRGFTRIFDTKIKENELPDVTEGQQMDISKKEIHEVVSRPPARFTQALLLKAMEDIQKYMPESELKTIMKKVAGIGQASSRGEIVRDLLQTGYIEEREKGGLYMTEKGLAYIHYLDGKSITDPALSAQWELHMQHIREGEEKYEDVRKQILDYVNESVREVMDSSFDQFNDTENTSKLPCPFCGKPLRKTSFGYGCSGYPDCRFSIGEIAHKRLTESQLSDLLTKHRTGVIKGFTNKKGTKFDAVLVLKNRAISFEFPESIRETKDLMCPVCGSPLQKFAWGYGCSEHKNGCNFVIGKIGGKMLTESQVKTLLNKERLGPLSGFHKKDGTTFEATLVLEKEEDENGKENYKVAFEHRNSLQNTAKDIYARCPVCGGTVVRGKWGWICGKNQCSEVPYKLSEREIEPETAEQIFAVGHSSMLEGFISKKQKPFSAILEMKDGKVRFSFPEN